MKSTYFMFGKYSEQSIRRISFERTASAVGIIEQHNGQILAIYALMGKYDIVIIANLPGTQVAMEVSIALQRATGISFATSPALSVDRYDSLILPDVDEQD